MEVVLIGQNRPCLMKIISFLSNHQNINCYDTDSLEAALEKVVAEKVDLVILEERFDSISGFQFAESLIEKNPMLYLAFISDLSGEDFHEATEGLGVIGSIPTSPLQEDIDGILSQIDRIQSML